MTNIYKPVEEKGKVADLINQSTEDMQQLLEFYATMMEGSNMFNPDKKYKFRLYIEDMEEVEGHGK